MIRVRCTSFFLLSDLISLFVCLSGLLLGNDKVHKAQTRWVGGAWFNLDFMSNFFGKLLLLEFAARVSLIFSDMLCCTRIKLGGRAKFGPTLVLE